MSCFAPLGTSIFDVDFTLEPGHWEEPLSLDFKRQFTRDNHNILGCSRYACMGSRIAMKYFCEILPGCRLWRPGSERESGLR